MGAISSRRHPYPWHVRLGAATSASTDRTGLMLLPDPTNGGLMLAKKQSTLENVVPTQQEYGSAPIYRERTFTCRPTGGYGERVQSSHGDRRYYWGIDIQVSGGLFGKGPLLHPIVPTTAAAGEVYRFVDVPNSSGGRDQIILAGQMAYRRADDTNSGQVVVRDFTAGVLAWDGVVFQGGYAGATANLYVATSTGALWERTPTNTWTACALPAGFLANRLEVVATELWAADMANCILRKCTADPKVAGSWSGPILVGDPSVRISCIRQTSNVLVVFKEDGSLFTLNSDGTVNDLFPGASVPISTQNGWRTQAWLNALWFNSGTTFYRLEMPGAQLLPSGPGKMLDNASPVRGEARVFCGWGGYQGYLVLYNAQDTPPTSYLLSYGSWEANQSGEGVTFRFDDQYDGSLCHWPNRIPTAMSVSGASGTDRLYVGFTDGAWDWYKLVVNPLATGSGAEFTLGPSEMVLPLHHAMFQADIKQWTAFTLFGPVMRVGDQATLSYRIMASAGAPPSSPTGDWLSIGTFQANGQTIDAPSNLSGGGLQLKVGLTNSSSSTTPVLETIAIHERVVPSFRRDIRGTVDGRSFTSRLDGATARMSAKAVNDLMMQVSGAPHLAVLELPDETVDEIAFFDYSARYLPRQAGGGGGWLIDFAATEFRVLTIYGTIARVRGTRIGELRGYSIASLRYL